MNRDRKPSRLGCLLALALGAMALLALPGVAAAKDRNHDRIPDRWESGTTSRSGSTRPSVTRTATPSQPRRAPGRRQPTRSRQQRQRSDGRRGERRHDRLLRPRHRQVVIDLFGSETVAGLVTESTRVECECDHRQGHHDERAMTERARDDGGPSDEPRSPRGPEPGDDHGGAQLRPRRPTRARHDDEAPASCTTADLVAGRRSRRPSWRSSTARDLHEVELAG